MMPPHMMGGPPGQGPPKPLFPSAVPTSSASSPGTPVVGADFKPITSGVVSTSKATFPAYSSATISAPPTTNPSTSSEGAPKVQMIATTGAASKIIHPAEDISLEEIRARLPKYQKTIPVKREEEIEAISSHSTEVSIFIFRTRASNRAFLSIFLIFFYNIFDYINSYQLTSIQINMIES